LPLGFVCLDSAKNGFDTVFYFTMSIFGIFIYKSRRWGKHFWMKLVTANRNDTPSLTLIATLLAEETWVSIRQYDRRF
jgi:hypothetical protein